LHTVLLMHRHAVARRLDSLTVEKREGFVISHNIGPGNTQTGHLERRTLLHKRYLIQKTIGRGGMGAVYQAKDVKRQQVVAVKEMGLSMVLPDERVQAIQNFKVEAKMLANLSHINLPAFTGFFAEGSRYYMVMEYIDGATLEELLERNHAPFPERRVLGWARQLCDVLEYLHNQQPPIIFRDMKPGNIMLTRDGHIKLIDFGIARFFRPTSSQDTQLLGTPGFAPPEQYGKAQTDERSDIYSLAITLFQLLTNTLSETGFGLRNVRAANPAISQLVAHALEKAASLEPEDRYASITEFRRALLGEGTFFFEEGDVATTLSELAELCLHYPEEAADYMASGEIEAWLREIGEHDLLRTVRHMRSLGDEPQKTVQMFIQAVMGNGTRIRGYTTRSGRGSKAEPNPTTPPSHNNNNKNGQAPTTPPSRGSKNGQAPTTPPSRGSKAGLNPNLNLIMPPSRGNKASQTPTASRGSRNWLNRKQTSPITVSPRTLDFGAMYTEVSTPLTITITSGQGSPISGSIDSHESWILLDQEQFDGTNNHIEVRIDGTQLPPEDHYTGQIIITSNGEGAQREIVVTVEAEVVSYPASSNGRRSRKEHHPIQADLVDLDSLDMEEDLFVHNRDVTLLSAPPPTTKTVARRQTSSHHAAIRGGREITGKTASQSGIRHDVTGKTASQTGIRRGQTGTQGMPKREFSSQSGAQIAELTSQGHPIPDRHTEYIAKYGPFIGQNQASNGWDPVHISTTQRMWMQRILTGMSAFMLASLGYNLVAHLISPQALPLPPNPWFILVQVLIIPAATLGAMQANWNRQWNNYDTLDSISTGLAGTLLTVAAVKEFWSLALHNTQPNWLLFVLLLTTAIVATIGINPTMSSNIMYGIGWAMERLRLVVIGVTIAIGGILGYALMVDFALIWVLCGILLGGSIAAALIWRVDQLMKQQDQVEN
jgi:serine/threonine protein kinase